MSSQLTLSRLPMFNLCLLLFLSAAVALLTDARSKGPPKWKDSNHVWLLGDDSGYHNNYDSIYTACDTTNVVGLTKDHMHVDYFTTVEQLRMVRFNLPLPADFIQIRMINEEQQDEVFVVVHEGHMSINRFGNYTTFPIAMKKASSLFMVADLACLTPASETHILCVNVIKGTQKVCNNKVPPGSHGYTSILPRPQLAYIVTPDAHGSGIQRFKVTDDCVSFIDGVSGGHAGNGSWFSYDGEWIFLSNGLKVNANDLSINGTFDNKAVGEVNYNWISQLYSTSMLSAGGVYRPIMALRDDEIDRLYVYTWPHLSANGSEAIPMPEGYSIVKPISLHYCQLDFAYAMVTYSNHKDNTLRTGVAYVKYYW